MDKKSPSNFILEWLFATGGVAIALYVLLTTIKIARAGWVAIPAADDWDRWITYLKYNYTPTWFLLEHVDHRLAAPKVLFAVDHLVFRGRGWFLLACAIAFQGATGFLLWRLAGQAYRQDRAERVMQAAAVATLVFSGQQWLNFIRPFQLPFPMVYCAAAAAFFAFGKASGPASRRTYWLAASILLSVVATYSMANGILVWPLLIAGALWLRLPKRQVVALTGAAVFTGAAYFYHWHKSIERSDQLGLAERISRIATFWIGHLGSPIFPLVTQRMSEKWEVTWAVCVGTVLAGAFLTTLVLFYRHRGQYRNAHVVLVLNCLFLVLTSGTIAYGRSGWSMMDLYSPRYLTPAYIFWAALLLVGWPVLRRMNHAALFALLCAAMAEGVALHQYDGEWISALWQNITRQAEAGIVDDVVDPDPWRIMYHTPPATLDTIDYLKRNRLTLFTEDWTHWPGTPIALHFTVDSNAGACRGEFAAAAEITSGPRPGWRLSGWAWDNKAGRAPEYLILADGSGQVAGVGLAGFQPSPQFPPLSAQYPSSPWYGYVKGPARSITAYLLEGDGYSLCAIGKRNFATD